MATIRELHDQAMELAQHAFLAKWEEEHDRATALFAQAFPLERQAAEMSTKEPTRSVLHRSAGWLALNAGLRDEARAMALAGLAGEPPSDIARELNELLEAI